MKTSWLIIFFGIVTVALGMLHIENMQKTRYVWNTIESSVSEENELNIEWNKLKLEESMLITGVLLDQEVRDHLGMVVPDSNTVVYVVEQKVPKRIVSTHKNKGNNSI